MADSNETRSLIEGALFAVLTLLIIAIGLYIPMLFFITSMLIPVPTIVMVCRHGFKKALMSLIVAFTLLFMLYADPIIISMLFIQFGPIGLLLGLLFKNQVSAGKTVIAGTITAALITVVVLLLTSTITGINLLSIENQLNDAFEESIKLYQDAGLIKDEATLNEMKQNMETTSRTVALLLPGTLVLSAMFSTLITYFLARAVLIRLKYSVTAVPAFSEWMFPWYTLWGIVIGLALMLFGDRFAYDVIAAIGKNILYVFGMCFLVLGISVAAYYYKRLPIHNVIKIILVVVLILWPFTPLLLLIVGIMDPLVDLRRLNSKTS